MSISPSPISTCYGTKNLNGIWQPERESIESFYFNCCQTLWKKRGDGFMQKGLGSVWPNHCWCRKPGILSGVTEKSIPSLKPSLSAQWGESLVPLGLLCPFICPAGGLTAAEPTQIHSVINTHRYTQPGRLTDTQANKDILSLMRTFFWTFAENWRFPYKWQCLDKGETCTLSEPSFYFCSSGAPNLNSSWQITWQQIPQEHLGSTRLSHQTFPTSGWARHQLSIRTAAQQTSILPLGKALDTPKAPIVPATYKMFVSNREDLSHYINKHVCAQVNTDK